MTQFMFNFLFQITKLKIESNPFAKGFRDSSSHEGDDPYPGVYTSHPGLPGGMPGVDPFSHMRPALPGPGEDNNNLLAAAEKARMMMMYRAAPLLPSPALPPPASLALPPELLARYSLATGLYNPALLAAMVRTSSSSSSLLSSSLSSAVSSPKSPSESLKTSQRFSPYSLPSSSIPNSDSPSRFSTLSDGDNSGRTPSPRSSSPPAPLRPPFPLPFR